MLSNFPRASPRSAQTLFEGCCARRASLNVPPRNPDSPHTLAPPPLEDTRTQKRRRDRWSPEAHLHQRDEDKVPFPLDVLGGLRHRREGLFLHLEIAGTDLRAPESPRMHPSDGFTLRACEGDQTTCIHRVQYWT